MLWVPLTRKTRSGAEFAGIPKAVLALQERAFDYAPLVQRAVACEHEDKLDREGRDAYDHDDPLNGHPPPPPLPPHDLFNDVDDENPHPKKRRRRVSFDEDVATSAIPPRTGTHRQRRQAAEHPAQ
ncbi:hypothetical protein C8F04DRAFT_1262634 [Mycena alexandri]|uniref:Uncharacterized protein n=1 Tax=Mycena alexandri TaxID=1745969 RepID=A0AAD6SE41_9AGAR|nr:hypothetical protein C8F04DRAFT_1268586 [Mycena alexandri]KAJ7031774.1 hypothetical protein C8F04DRAFT_1262634 [Mycena alexandri]